VKNIVYQVKIDDLQHLRASIRDTLSMVTPNMLQATWNEVEYHLDICCATKGAYIEFTEKVIYSEKNTNVYNKCFLRYTYFILDLSSGHPVYCGI
jgi:hypothetical protein